MTKDNKGRARDAARTNFRSAPFNPEEQEGAALAPNEAEYVYADRRIVLAVNTALVTGRPLFVTGLPGSGKSTLALDVARRLRWTYVETVITSRTRLDDLVASVDLVRRLSDGQARDLKSDKHYLIPGPFWWAVAPAEAKALPAFDGGDPRRWPEQESRGVVILLDEMDKAEPDLPNDLLGPLNRLRIVVPTLGIREPRVPILVVVTSNNDREMPPAFLRRCINLDLGSSAQDVDFLVAVAQSHFPDEGGQALFRDVAHRALILQRGAEAAGRRLPSTAEYLDTIRACIEFDEAPGSPLWDAIEEAALRKTRTTATGDEIDD